MNPFINPEPEKILLVCRLISYLGKMRRNRRHYKQIGMNRKLKARKPNIKVYYGGRRYADKPYHR